ncbi:MAG: hypothetical protein H6712_15880 [Myxococcales bacterium]|nr:hypothetical protein [Myxococcales bacterium]MCB9715347.1 hypothetical protein [Myxococcales bacterium]
MEWLLRRNFWVVKLLGLAMVTALAANTTTTVLALVLLSSTGERPAAEDDDEPEEDEDAPTLAKTSTAIDARARRAERTAERILGYNPMCPTCGPAPVVTDPIEPGAIDPTNAELAGAQRSALPLVVAATMESEDPELSVATLVDVERGIGGLYGVGDSPSAGVEVVRVTTGVVHIVNAGRLEYIPFGAVPPPAPKPSATKPAAEPAAKPNSRAIPGAEEAISCDDKGDCVVERAFVESLIAQPNLLMGQGAAAPTTTTDGSPGFKLRGVRKGTLPDLLGLKNGDVITEVSGAPLTLDTLPGLFGKLRHASHIEVTVDRRGQRVSRQVEIRS